MSQDLSPRQAGQRTGTCLQHIYRLIRSGLLKAYRVGNRHWRITEADLEAFIAKRTNQAEVQR